MADKKLFALCVGINKYPEGVSNLAGCVTDAENWKNFIEANYQKTLSPEVLLLKNEQAKRDAFIDAVRKHLGQARDGDTVFLHYSGHGSREAAPPAYLKYFPDGKNETLVLSDSRAKDEDGNYNGHDLADKELGKLLEELIQGKPNLNMVISLDCCHSGSGTRDAEGLAKSRLTGDRADEARSFETYIPGIFTGAEVVPPSSKHILLAACSKTQKAWETKEKTGLFTTSALDVLDKYGVHTTYADLFIRTRAKVKNITKIQEPQLEAYKKYNANQILFTGEIQEGKTKYAQKIYYIDKSWIVDFGAIHGMPNEKETELAVYENVDDLEAQNALGSAKSVAIRADKSTLNLDFEADVNKEYVGEFLAPPVIPMTVLMYGEQAGYEALQEQLEDNKSMYFQLDRIDESEGHTFKIEHPTVKYFTKISVLDKEGQKVTPRAGTYLMIALDGNFYLLDEYSRVIQGFVGGFQDEDSIPMIFKMLDQIAQWENLTRLQNNSPKISPDKIDFIFHDDEGNAVEGNEFTSYLKEVINPEYDKPIWEGNYFSLKVKNNSKQTLHYSLIYMDDSYISDPVSGQELKAGHETTLILNTNEDDEGNLVDIIEGSTWIESEGNAYDEDLDIYRANRNTMLFKLLVSTEQLDNFTLRMDSIDIGAIDKSKALKSRSRTPTTRQVKHDWFTKTITIHTVRQRSKLGDNGVTLGDNNKLFIKGNPDISANLQLGAANSGSRSTDKTAMLPALLSHQEGSLVNFGEASDNSNILEVSHIEGDETLATNPLEITLGEDISNDEMFLPLTFDGEHILSVGEEKTDAEGNTYVTVEEVPEIEEGSRSLGKSLKLAFFKIALKRHPDKIYQLAWVDYLNTQDKNGKEEIDRHKNNDEVAEKVKAANKVLLLIHGIIGDTEDMAIAVKDMIAEKGYDLVLSFDYENLNSSIRDDISWSLKDQLERVGFNANDGKELHILAQGMGCLVARWMVEQRKGKEFVDRLILAGPPNQGSVLGHLETCRKFATMALSLALNVVSPLASWAGGLFKGVNTAMKQGKKLTTTLAEMQEGSTLIRDLNDSDDSGIPYLILAGDVRNYESTDGSDFTRFKEKMFKKVGSFANSGESNDMIVDFDSMKRPGKNSNVTIKEVVCHHLNYFSEEASLEAIRKVL